jgi:hypothetical protein
MDGQATLHLPTPHGALVALKKSGDLLPGVEALLGIRLRRRRKSFVFSAMSVDARSCPFVSIAGGGGLEGL